MAGCDGLKVEAQYEECIEKNSGSAKNAKEVEQKCLKEAKQACGGDLGKKLEKAIGEVNKMVEKVMNGKGAEALKDIGAKIKEGLSSIHDGIAKMFKG